MENKVVSIVIPVYNAFKFLEETVESVLGQTYREWELWLIDDCSSDGSFGLMDKYANQYSNIYAVKQEQNGGAAKARNKGLKLAKGRYLAFLDADDIWKPDKLERQISFMETKQASFTFTGYEFADEGAVGTGKVVRVPESLTYRQALKNTTIFTSTVLFDMSKTGKELLAMPDIASEDTATWWKILRNGHRAWGLDENLVLYRRSAKTLSSNKIKAVKRIWRLYREAEGLSFCYSVYNFVFYAVRAVLRRV